jgi:CRISPR-associated protein Csa3
VRNKSDKNIKLSVVNMMRKKINTALSKEKCMKTTLIATLGFEEKFCYRAILRHGIKEGDEIVLITAEIVEKVEKAFDWIKKLVQTSFSDKVAVRLVQLDVKSVEKSIKAVSELLNSAEGRLIVNLSGGMRALVIIVLIACIMKARREMVIEIETEDLSSLLLVPSELIRLVKDPPGSIHLEILRLVKRGIRKSESISRELKRDASTIRRHLAELEAMGLVEAEKRKPLIVRLTRFAELFV